ncbi:folate family ECF transporter S component [Peptoniphilus raoultii]|uniref:folate family ECF transporter S component n=1 Tax=Peptoniphilus raoultii TaxID=1776387 RepID=UPI0008D954CE|nr:folate family ECF transporter S component [Peptoniphilus raoultii]
MERQVINTKVLVRASFLCALSVVLTRFLSVMLTANLRVGLGWMPLILSGTLFGPLVGGLCGLVTDLVGVAINPMGTIHLGFTLSSILTGLIPGLCSYFLKGKKDETVITFSVILVAIFVHAILNTIWLTQLYGDGFLVILPPRILKIGIESIAVIVTGIVLSKVLKKL